MQDEKILQHLSQDSQRERGFRLLVDTYGDRLYQHIRRMLTSDEDAQDVLQNTLVKVYRSIDRFKGNSQLYTWLYRIATNESLTFLNKQKRQRTVFVEKQEDHSRMMQQQKASSQLNAQYIQERLQLAMNELPAKQRAVFSLRYFEEKTYKEMSLILDTSVGALKASYHHAVKKIEAFIKA